VPWLTDPLRRFGERLGTVLFRVPDGVRRDDDKLAALLAAWPRDLPLTIEFQDPSWHVDEVFAALASAGAALCTTELPEDDAPPTIRGPVPSSISGSGATTTRRPTWRTGQRVWSRSSPTGWTRSCSSVTTRRVGARSWRSSSPRWAATTTGAGTSRALGRAERHEQRQLLGDVVEAGAGRRSLRTRSTRREVPDLVTDRDPATARDHVVDLVLGVRLLEVRLAGARTYSPTLRSGTVMNSR
jgi:hypothetical protein